MDLFEKASREANKATDLNTGCGADMVEDPTHTSWGLLVSGSFSAKSQAHCGFPPSERTGAELLESTASSS